MKPAVKTKVICVAGKARNGKDTFAEFLCNELDDESCEKSILITHYADLVKYICKVFFDWNGEKDEAGRTLLQYIGTDRVRKHRPDFWVDFIVDVLKLFPDEWDYVIIPDCRFPNEINRMKEEGFDVTSVRVVRTNFDSQLTDKQKNHPSETALDDFNFDCVIHAADLDGLRRMAETFAKQIKECN